MRKILITLSIFLASCQFTSIPKINITSDKNDGEKIVNEFYQFLAQKQLDSAMKYFHPNLLRVNDPAKLKEFLANTSAQLAVLKERKLDHWSTKSSIGLQATSEYEFYYLNKYENFELKVSFKLMKDVNHEIKIVGLQMNPDKFLSFPDK